MNSNIFICYRKSNNEIASTLYRRIKQRKASDCPSIGKVWYSNNIINGNYLEAIDNILPEYDHVIILIDCHFTKGFFNEDHTENLTCITSKELVRIGKRILDPNDDIKLYALNIGDSVHERQFSLECIEDITQLFINHGIEEAVDKIIKLNEFQYSITDTIESKDHKLDELINSIVNKGILDNIDTNKYLSFYINKELAYKTLPENKIKNCIYARSINYGKLKDIEVFKNLYIDKKVYKYDNNDDISSRVLQFSYDILKNDSVLIGNAGCGKSTLLFHLYIEYVENIKNKIIPIFLDLNQVNKQDKINKSRNLIEAINYNARFHLKGNIPIDKIYQELNELGYRVVLIMDSLDECQENDIISQINMLRHNSSFFLNASGIKYNIILGLRQGAFDLLHNDLSLNYKKYIVRDFDSADVDKYIDCLIKLDKIKYHQISSIKQNVELITYTDNINPFLLSMIIQRYVDNPEYHPETFKIVDLLNENVNALVKDINVGRNINGPITRMTLEIIGINGLSKINTNDIYSLYNFNELFRKDKFLDDIDSIKNNTYLLNTQNKFYQKIFSDFFGASYVLNTFSLCYNNPKYQQIINDLLNDYEHNEFFECLALLTDAHEKNLFKSPLNDFLDYMFENATEDIVFHNIIVMLKAIDRYSTKKVIKDELPIIIEATYNPDQFTTYIYLKYFKYLINKQIEINYGYFYNVISICLRQDLALQAIIELSTKEDAETLFTMLSILRDSYTNINLQLKTKNNINSLDIEVIHAPYLENTTKEEMMRIFKLAVHDHDFTNMNLREALNACFYAKKDIDFIKFKDNLIINYHTNYFPTIYNLDLFVINEDYERENKIQLVNNDDHLIFASDVDETKNFSVKIFTSNDIIDKNCSIPNHLISAFFYCDNDESFSINKIKENGSLISVDICQGITGLDVESMQKCFALRNIILPKTIKKLGMFSIYYAKRLEHIVIPEGVEEIGESVLEDCFSLKRIVLPTTLKTIGNYLFEQCVSCETIDFQYNHVELTDGTFVGCRSIHDFENDLHLSHDITKLPKICFGDCQGLKRVDLSNYNKLLSIGSYCFSDCTSLEEIIFPNSINKLDIAIFYGCNNLQRIVFNSLPNCSKEVLAGLDHQIEIIINNKSYQVDSNEAFINILKDYNVTLINDYFINGVALKLKDDLTYNLDDSFNCDNQAFNKFSSEDYPNIKITSTTIGALGNHEFLDDVYFDEHLLEASDWMFEDCTSLYNVKLGKTKLQIINAHMFENCETLKEIVLPSTITRIEKYAFENCGNLTNVHFLKNCQEENCIFSECDEIKRLKRKCNKYKDHVLNIPCNIEYIGDYAFHNCYNIEEVIINSPNTVISDLAFEGCPIKKIDYPFKKKLDDEDDLF